jgi:hypothetical protein
MKILKEDLNKLSFADYAIEAMALDIKMKILDIKIDGASFKLNENWKKLGMGTIKIFDWKKIAISMYDSKGQKWVNLGESNWDNLKEICEIELNETLCLKGFGKRTGQWIQFDILSPKIDINFLD